MKRDKEGKANEKQYLLAYKNIKGIKEETFVEESVKRMLKEA